MKTFAQRLTAAQVAGNLRTSDLQVWFRRPYHTVRGWLLGHEPYENVAEVHRRLVLLEQTIKRLRGLPIPYTTKRHERRALVEGALRAANSGISSARAAR